MSEKHKKTCGYLNFEVLLILDWTITGCVSASAFTSLVAIPVGITSSAVGLNICIITVVNKKYGSNIKKKKKKHDLIVLLGKNKLDAIEVLISKALIDSYINHDEFVLVNNVLKVYIEMRDERKNSDTSVEYIIQIWLI